MSVPTFAVPWTSSAYSGFLVRIPTLLFSASTWSVFVSTVRLEVTYTLPTTWRLAEGATKPIPTLPAGVTATRTFVPTSVAWFAMLNVSLMELSIPTEKFSPLVLNEITGSFVVSDGSSVSRASLPLPLTYTPPVVVAITWTGWVVDTVPTPTWEPTYTFVEWMFEATPRPPNTTRAPPVVETVSVVLCTLASPPTSSETVGEASLIPTLEVLTSTNRLETAPTVKSLANVTAPVTSRIELNVALFWMRTLPLKSTIRPPGSW